LEWMICPMMSMNDAAVPSERTELIERCDSYDQPPAESQVPSEPIDASSSKLVTAMSPALLASGMVWCGA